MNRKLCISFDMAKTILFALFLKKQKYNGKQIEKINDGLLIPLHIDFCYNFLVFLSLCEFIHFGEWRAYGFKTVQFFALFFALFFAFYLESTNYHKKTFRFGMVVWHRLFTLFAKIMCNFYE